MQKCTMGLNIGVGLKRKMTLIIGARFKDGVILVADRKITGRETKFGYKFITPIENMLAFGCAGYLNKIQEFDRKVKDVVNQRIRETKIKNQGYYAQQGLAFQEIVQEEVKPEKLNPDELNKKEEIPTNTQTVTQNPEVFVYSTENFIDDCKEIICSVCTGRDNIIRNEVELLLILFSDVPKLHHISSAGEEEEILDFHAIGSGSPLVNYILKKHWKPEMNIEQIIKLCFFCIYYIQDLEIDDSVGIEKDGYPDHLVIVNEDGIKYWSVEDNKEKADTFVKDIKKSITNLKKTINHLSF